MQRKPLEVSLYVAGAGAFGVFLRWMQDQLAFNEAGLVDKSAFNVLVPLFVAAACLVFRSFLRQEERQGVTVPADFDLALFQQGRLLPLACRLAGAMMVVGAMLLFASSETDKLVRHLRVLAGFGALTGICFPLLLAQVDRERKGPGLLCWLSFVPILFFAIWLVYTYRANSINSVIWAYVLEMATVSMAMGAFFRLAGYAFGSPNAHKARFDAMITATLCIMCLADERYLGMHVMLLATAAMLILENWILMDNRMEPEREEKEEKPKHRDGFEHLN